MENDRKKSTNPSQQQLFQEPFDLHSLTQTVVVSSMDQLVKTSAQSLDAGIRQLADSTVDRQQLFQQATQHRSIVTACREQIDKIRADENRLDQMTDEERISFFKTHDFWYSVLLGGQLAAAANIRKTAQKYSHIPEMHMWQDAEEGLFVTPVMVEVNGLSFYDVAFGDPNSINPSDYLRLFIELTFPNEQSFIQAHEHLRPNEVPQYILPEFLQPQIHRSLFGIQANDIGKYKTELGKRKGKKDQNLARALEVAIQLKTNMGAIQNKIHENLFNGLQQGDPQLLSQLARYINLGDDHITIGSFIALQVYDDDNWNKVYRLSKRFGQKGIAEYAVIADTMLDRIEKANPADILLVISDLEMIRHSNDPELPETDDALVQFENLEQRYNALPRDTRVAARDDLRVDQSLIDFRRFKIPYRLSFHKDRNSNSIQVLMLYKNDVSGEETGYVFEVDLRTGAFDWYLIDDPNSAEAASIREDCKHIVRQIVDVLANLPAGSTNISSNLGARAEKNGHNRDPVYALRKMLRTSNLNVTSAKNPQDAEVLMSETRAYKPILLDNIGSFETNLGKEVVARVIAAITRFNMRENIRHQGFRKLETVDRYRLTVGPYRVIVAETSQGYEIIDIGDRKDIYQ